MYFNMHMMKFPEYTGFSNFKVNLFYGYIFFLFFKNKIRLASIRLLTYQATNSNNYSSVYFRFLLNIKKSFSSFNFVK